MILINTYKEVIKLIEDIKLWQIRWRGESFKTNSEKNENKNKNEKNLKASRHAASHKCHTVSQSVNI